MINFGSYVMQVIPAWKLWSLFIVLWHLDFMPAFSILRRNEGMEWKISLLGSRREVVFKHSRFIFTLFVLLLFWQLTWTFVGVRIFFLRPYYCHPLLFFFWWMKFFYNTNKQLLLPFVYLSKYDWICHCLYVYWFK